MESNSSWEASGNSASQEVNLLFLIQYSLPRWQQPVC
jgi:hypothetical protein